MIEIKYTCDRCKQEVKQIPSCSIELYTVAVGIWSNLYSYPSSPTWKSPPQQWCKNCLKETGIWRPPASKEEKVVPVPTLEDMIRDIVRSEVQA